MRRTLPVSINTQVIGSSLVYLERINSTNTFAKRFPGHLLSNGMVIFAEDQFAGRGTNRRKWVNGKDDLAVTIVLREREEITEAFFKGSTSSRLPSYLYSLAALASVRSCE